MTTTEERINDAISRLTKAALAAHAERRLSKGRLAAINSLGNHWRAFWVSKERELTPQVVLKRKLGRYVQWYTRAWAFLPVDVRARLPVPDQIDPSYAGIARDALEAYVAQVKRTANAAEEAADALKHTIDRTLTSGAIGVVLGAFAVWYLFMRGNRS